MRPVHWYHIWVGDTHHGSAWHTPAAEHFALLESSGFDGEVRAGIVGGVRERVECVNWLRQQKVPARVAVTADEGFEQVTIEAMHTWAKSADPAAPVLYCHTKGALQAHPMNTLWRNSMDKLLTGAWRERVADLDRYDAVGLHWLTHKEYPAFIDPRKPMFGGNFWWSKAGYLAGLERVRGTPEFPPVNRWEAEGWLGQGFPEVLDLAPGWPDYTRAA